MSNNDCVMRTVVAFGEAATEPGGYRHWLLHTSAPSSCEWGAMKRDGSLSLVRVTTLGGPEQRVRRFGTPSSASRYGQPVLLLVRPHGRYCGCAALYDFRGSFS